MASLASSLFRQVQILLRTHPLLLQELGKGQEARVAFAKEWGERIYTQGIVGRIRAERLQAQFSQDEVESIVLQALHPFSSSLFSPQERYGPPPSMPTVPSTTRTNSTTAARSRSARNVTRRTGWRPASTVPGLLS